MNSEAMPRGSRGTGEAASIRVLLVDDHPMWRDTLRRVLEASRTAKVVAEAADGEEAIAKARSEEPDVIVMDIALPKVDGIEATRRLCAERLDPRVLVLSSSDEPAQVVRAVKAGATGYLVKTAGSADVADAVRRIAAGELVFPPSLAAVVRDELRRSSEEGPRHERTPLDELTSRERDVLALMAEGRSNQAICRQLHLSPKTVEGYIASIFSKLGLEPAESDHRRVRAVITYLGSR